MAWRKRQPRTGVCLRSSSSGGGTGVTASIRGRAGTPAYADGWRRSLPTFGLGRVGFGASRVRKLIAPPASTTIATASESRPPTRSRSPELAGWRATPINIASPGEVMTSTEHQLSVTRAGSWLKARTVLIAGCTVGVAVAVSGCGGGGHTASRSSGAGLAAEPAARILAAAEAAIDHVHSFHLQATAAIPGTTVSESTYLLLPGKAKRPEA